MVTRVKRISESTGKPREEFSSQSDYRGFGSVRGETSDEFHDRMYDLDPLEAMIYEMELALTLQEVATA